MNFITNIILITLIACGPGQVYAKGQECPNTTFKGFNSKNFTDMDLACYKTAKRRCGEIYKDSPCLKVFQKTGEMDYRAICGQEKR